MSAIYTAVHQMGSRNHEKKRTNNTEEENVDGGRGMAGGLEERMEETFLALTRQARKKAEK